MSSRNWVHHSWRCMVPACWLHGDMSCLWNFIVKSFLFVAVIQSPRCLAILLLRQVKWCICRSTCARLWCVLLVCCASQTGRYQPESCVFAELLNFAVVFGKNHAQTFHWILILCYLHHILSIYPFRFVLIFIYKAAFEQPIYQFISLWGIWLCMLEIVVSKPSDELSSENFRFPVIILCLHYSSSSLDFSGNCDKALVVLC